MKYERVKKKYDEDCRKMSQKKNGAFLPKRVG